MNQTITQITRRAAQYGRYRQLVRELRSMSVDTALDLDIYPGDVEKIAHQAVYGA